MLGSGVDLALHFALGYAGANAFAQLGPTVALIVGAGLLAAGFLAWLVIARRKRASAFDGWAQATCPVCLVVATVSPASI